MTILASEESAPQRPVELSVLGAFRARVDGAWRDAPTRQVAKVATILSGWPGEPVERDRIVAGVWGENTPATVTNTLQVHVSHLRRLIGKATVRSQGSSYVLDVTPEAVDAEQFVDGVHEAARMRRHEHYGRAAELLDQSLRLWRGTPFPDVADPDLEARRARLTELRDQAREDLLECRLELAGDRYALADVIADAKELVSRQPLREKGHVLLVRALSAADRQGEASAAFDDAAGRMRSTLGLDPGRDLVDVHTRGLNRDDTLLPAAMRRITILPSSSPETAAFAGVGERVRSAVVDAGARSVLVEEPDGERAQYLAAAIGHALVDDMPGGVVLVSEDSADPASVARTVSAAGPELDTLDRIEGLGLVVVGTGPKARALLTAAMATANGSAVVLVGQQGKELMPQLVIRNDAGMDE